MNVIHQNIKGIYWFYKHSFQTALSIQDNSIKKQAIKQNFLLTKMIMLLERWYIDCSLVFLLCFDDGRGFQTILRPAQVFFKCYLVSVVLMGVSLSWITFFQVKCQYRKLYDGIVTKYEDQQIVLCFQKDYSQFTKRFVMSRLQFFKMVKI